MEIDKIKLHPIGICNEMACCIAYCIGATYENVEEIASQIPEDKVFECVEMIRNKVKDNWTDVQYSDEVIKNEFIVKV